MHLIHLTTFIAAPVERVFDLSRSVSLHKFSMQKYEEQVTGGNYSPLMELNETVTWTAKQLMKKRTLTSRITSYNRPFSFIDEQVAGDFKKMKHEHHFKPIENGTIMIDQLFYELPYAGLGKWFNRIYFNHYFSRLLEERNKAIKAAAEGDSWKQYL